MTKKRKRETDPTNAVRQRRYIGRLKSAAEISDWYEQENARLREKIADLEQELQRLNDASDSVS